MLRHRTLTVGLLLLAGLPALGAAPPAPVELFPVLPGTGDQRGFAVAVDGDRMAMGAPQADGVTADGEAAKASGAVHLFLWNGSTRRWEPEATLTPDSLSPGGRFGGALALREGLLAVGALGEGAVYVYRQVAGRWVELVRVSGRTGMFGRSLALDSGGSGRLVVGEVAPHGDAPGKVHLFTPLTLGPAAVRRTVRRAAALPQGGNRFGEAVALDGGTGTLMVGDPSYDRSSGAVYVLTKETGFKVPEQVLKAPDGQPGDQFGAAVALSGDHLVAGAPTAHPECERECGRSGAVYASGRGGGVWGPVQRLTVAAPLRGEELGAAVALDGDLLAAGAPAPVTREGAPGTIRVFRHGADGWREAGVLQPANSGPRYLTGFAVAVQGGRIAAGAVLGGQGGPVSGGAWTFSCPPDGCAEEGEAVVPDPATERHVAVAVALSGDLLAVGMKTSVDVIGSGIVYLYRRTGAGWRQEARLTSPSSKPRDSFGSALALDGGTLMVGAPSSWTADTPRGVSEGIVYEYRLHGGAWKHFATISPDSSRMGNFGAGLVLAGDTLAVGAPTNGTLGVDAGAVFVYRRDPATGIWSPDNAHPALTAPGGGPGDRFGSAVSLRGSLLAVGAPSVAQRTTLFAPARLIELPGAGAVFLFDLAPSGAPAVRLDAPLQDAGGTGRFGAAVSLGDGVLAVGEPGIDQGPGIVRLYTGPPWTAHDPPVLNPGLSNRFGAAVVLSGDLLLAGAPGSGNAFKPPGAVHFFRLLRNGLDWSWLQSLAAVHPARADRFGAVLAFDGKTAAATSPGAFGGAWVTVFPPPVEGPP